MQSFVRDTMQLTDGTWKSDDGDPVPSACDLADSKQGVTWSWNQSMGGVDDPQALVQKVEQHWKSAGYQTSTDSGPMKPSGTLYTVVGVGSAVKSISVNASTFRVSIEVDSKCGTGDIEKIYEERDGS
jgi:hypothetical protein